MKKKTKQNYVVWMSNHTDSRDDEPVKIKAHSVSEAEDLVQLRSNFSIGRVFTLKEFYRFHPDWRGLI